MPFVSCLTCHSGVRNANSFRRQSALGQCTLVPLNGTVAPSNGNDVDDNDGKGGGVGGGGGRDDDDDNGGGGGGGNIANADNDNRSSNNNEYHDNNNGNDDGYDDDEDERHHHYTTPCAALSTWPTTLPFRGLKLLSLGQTNFIIVNGNRNHIAVVNLIYYKRPAGQLTPTAHL
eukprot:scaffold48890_cov19-Prasinocladus_malaysianus.AAC.2